MSTLEGEKEPEPGIVEGKSTSIQTTLGDPWAKSQEMEQQQ